MGCNCFCGSLASGAFASGGRSPISSPAVFGSAAQLSTIMIGTIACPVTSTARNAHVSLPPAVLSPAAPAELDIMVTPDKLACELMLMRDCYFAMSDGLAQRIDALESFFSVAAPTLCPQVPSAQSACELDGRELAQYDDTLAQRVQNIEGPVLAAADDAALEQRIAGIERVIGKLPQTLTQLMEEAATASSAQFEALKTFVPESCEDICLRFSDTTLTKVEGRLERHLANCRSVVLEAVSAVLDSRKHTPLPVLRVFEAEQWEILDIAYDEQPARPFEWPPLPAALVGAPGSFSRNSRVIALRLVPRPSRCTSDANASYKRRELQP